MFPHEELENSISQFDAIETYEEGYAWADAWGPWLLEIAEEYLKLKNQQEVSND